ncbi:hypothetical protein EIN_114940 [Entamoeba invadens IP1]|uniref:Uncharacterized protein n=1 Tax=Entamoeba invadens IP1 TaxID=370355 RepID=A0A0A1TXY7_ENTIV|nr:hypothetical protein EIN_114940 [Entamoeba invadens IP1]ELP86290.1 hypothetical protein EIN_114940 [Entamoeba invadens IP1]|eukprot:XP_004185636.1 hypothetical protein EIN_114940 [Entamoeba invadens IP1]
MWSTVEQLVLIESIQYIRPQVSTDWIAVSETVIKTLLFNGPVDQKKYDENECYKQLKELENRYGAAIPAESSFFGSLNAILRKKRIEELDYDIETCRRNLQYLEQYA